MGLRLCGIFFCGKGLKMVRKLVIIRTLISTLYYNDAKSKEKQP